MSKVAVIGASGLVGGTLVERLLATGSHEVIPFIHSSGNAMRLARRGVQLRLLDLLDRSQVDSVLEGVTHVVNCSRGADDVMLTGLKNLLSASRKHGIQRFVHLSSVAVYGDPPPLQSVQEDAPTNPVPGSYGWLKLQQDQMVMKAAAKGLPSLILCPPNISGPHSYFLLSLVDTLRANAFALLETGTSPCNLIDVVNLSHAIELALLNGPEDGTRMFVTDDAPTTWRDVIESLLPLVESTTDIPSVSREQLASVSTTNEKTSLSLTKSLKHLISSHVREAMRKDPLLEKVDVTVRRGIARMGKALESRLRLSLEGPSKIVKVTVAPKFNSGLCRQQLRGVQHSCALAKSHIGYKPIYTAAESMEAFCRWYRSHHGMDLGVWSLLRQLN